MTPLTVFDVFAVSRASRRGRVRVRHPLPPEGEKSTYTAFDHDYYYYFREPAAAANQRTVARATRTPLYAHGPNPLELYTVHTKKNIKFTLISILFFLSLSHPYDNAANRCPTRSDGQVNAFGKRRAPTTAYQTDD